MFESNLWPPASRRGLVPLLLAALTVALSGGAAMAEPSAAEQALWERVRKVQEAHLRAIHSFEATYEAGIFSEMFGETSSVNVVAAEFDMMKPRGGWSGTTASTPCRATSAMITSTRAASTGSSRARGGGRTRSPSLRTRTSFTPGNTGPPHSAATLDQIVTLPGYELADPNNRLVSATEDEPGTVVVRFAYHGPAGEGWGVWTFDRSVGYLPTRYEGGNVETGLAQRVQEIRYARQVVDGNVLFYPVEATGEWRGDADADWSKQMYMKVDEDTLRLNPKLPDERFELAIRPEDSVFNPSSGRMSQVGRRDGGALADGSGTDEADDATAPEPIRLDRNPVRPGGPISLTTGIALGSLLLIAVALAVRFGLGRRA